MRQRTSGLAAWSTVALLAAGFAHATPSGGEISAGAGSISEAAGALTIDQSSTKLAIDWRSFSIGAGESVTFNQPSAQSIALNRILGTDPSVILGNLSANGQIFLLNPNGVLFGAGAQVDVGGIVASTLGLSNADFLAGRYTFGGPDGAGAAVLNQGQINAGNGGYVLFAGQEVINDGVISARFGMVGLGAGAQVTMNLAGSALVGFSVDKAAVAALAANHQLIAADGGAVILSSRAKDALLSTVLNNDGIVEARSVSDSNGVIRLDGGDSGVVTVSGALDASGRGAGESGGRIDVTGDNVALLDDARLDASGAAGGGVVRVGGGFQGNEPGIDNASRTFVATSASIVADALEAGDGGAVVVWADGDTRYHGSITARGGAGGGDGGFVEVSAKQQLAFDGGVDTTARHGVTGTLLLDPDDLYIAAAAVGGALPDATNPFQAIDGINNYYVLASTLTALPATTAVQLQAGHNIIVQTSLSMPTTAAGSMNFNAGNAISMAGFNLSTAGGDVGMTAGAGGITGLGTINLVGGTLTVDSSGAITQNAGDTITGATALVKRGAGVLTLSTSNGYTGATVIEAGTLRLGAANRIGNSSAVTVVSGATFDLNNFAETVASIAGAGSITLGSGTLMAGGSGASTEFSGSVSGTGGLTKTGAGVLTLSGSNNYTGITTISGGTLRAMGGDAIGDASRVNLSNAAGVLLDLAADETIGNLSGGGGNGGNVALNANRLTVNQAANTTFAGVASGTGGIVKQGAGILTLSRANTYTGTTAIEAGTLAFGVNNVLANASQIIVNGGTLAIGSRTDTVAGVQLLSGAITGSGVLTSTSDYDLQAGTVSARLGGTTGLTKSTGGTVLLSGANAYTGDTAINDGTLRLGAANRIGNASDVIVGSGATFDLSNNAETVASIAGAGSITLGSATLASGGTGASTEFTGSVTGTGGLTKTGAGVLTLSGSNSYSGTTTISGGTLRAAGGSAIGDASQVTLANTVGVLLDLVADEAIGNLSGGGANGGNVALNANTLSVNQSGNTTFAGNASGAGGLIKPGAGQLTLSRANSYTGDTVIEAGTLRLSGGAAIADAGAVVVNGGTLRVSTAETIGSLSGAGGSAVLLNSTLTFGDAADTNIASTISGNGALIKLGSGATTLTGTNTYTGTTTINGGTLVAGSAGALGGTGSGTTVGNGATLAIANVALGSEALTLNGAGSSGGALVGIGAASAGGTVTLASSATIAALAATDTLTLNGTVNGAQALIQAGAGTVVFANTVGATTPLTSFASNAGATTRINGGVLRTSGTQSYDGALVTGGATQLRTTNSSISGQGAVNASTGTLTIIAGAGDVTFANAANDFSSVVINNAGTVDLRDANALALGTSNVRTLHAQAGGNLSVNGVITATGPGDSIELVSAGNFINNAGATALNPGAGRWLVWSTNPSLDARGGLSYAFKQYGATYGATVVAGSGNGFLYSLAPLITVDLTGAVTKLYDGDATASLTPANFVSSGAIDGDTVTVLTPTTGTYDNRNAGVNKNVAATGLSIVDSMNGGAPVYGYQLTDTAANADIGSITPAALTITAVTNTKVYDGTTVAAATPTVTGLVGGDSISNLSETYDDKNVGVGKTLSIASYTINDGNGGNNYVVGSIDVTDGVINPATLIGSFTAANKIYDATTLASIVDRSLSGVFGADDVSYVGGTAAFDDKNAGLGKTVTATGLSLAGSDAANYAVNSTATSTADIAALAITGAITAADKIYDGSSDTAIASRTLSGVLGADVVNYVGGNATFADANAGAAKLVTAMGLSLSGADASNYVVNSTATTFADIMLRPLTVTADPLQTKIYADADPLAYTYAITGGSLVTGESLSGALSRDAGENVGDYAITQNTLTAGSNYDLSFLANPFAITPATLIYLANPVQLIQGAPLPPFTGTVEGFKGSDTLASATTGTLGFSSTAANSSQAGAFPIDGYGLSANMGNYVFNQAPANNDALLIIPAIDPSLPISDPTSWRGAVAGAAQNESPCALLRDAPSSETLCAAQQNYRQTQQMNLQPGFRRLITLDGDPFALRDGGILLPFGVGVQ